MRSANAHITLTVFPFEDLSLERELGIFCRSFSVDLVTELSRFRQFQVISLPARANDTGVTTTGWFEDLQTDYFIQGTFRCEQEKVRINVQLYNNESRHMLWGNRFEGKLTSLHEIQDNLLAGVVGELQQQINYDLLSGIRKRQRIEFKAYEHWLHGMEELKKGSLENDLSAREHFQKALQIHNDYSLAYAGMSLSYFNEWSCQLWDRWEVSKTGAAEWAQKAIEIDDQNYIAAMVLGKIFLYEGAYDTAEYYFRKSLFLNSNDPDAMIQIALCFLFLGLEKEAIELYEKVMRLNPLGADKYSHYGVFIYFELGEFEKAASLIKRGPHVKMADADAYYAAVYYYLEQPEKMHLYWNYFLDIYRKLFRKGNDFDVKEAIDWIVKIGPYRYKTRMEAFLRYIGDGSFPTTFDNSSQLAKDNRKENHFVKEAATWKLSYDGSVVQVPELKGFFDIQQMLVEPRRVFHCAELMGSAVNDNGEKLIDDKARKQYQKKIIELQSGIQEAEERSDFVAQEKLQAEYDRLVDHLSKALGLKGKARQTGSTVEKARSAVTWRIRKAIARIEQYHPNLGAHLSNAIKTGTICSYHPEREITWLTS